MMPRIRFAPGVTGAILLGLAAGCTLVEAPRVDEAFDPDGDGYDWPEDCDGGDPAIHPEAAEVCDGIDNDCNDEVDDDPDQWPRWYCDEDGDGYGANACWEEACEAPSGYTAEPGDCDETDPDVNPGQDEICFDGRDTDCDGLAGSCGFDGTYETDALPVALRGGTDHGGAGTSVAGIGDFDGDGIDDLLVGAPFVSSSAGSQSGAAYLLLGPVSQALDLVDADITITGAGEGDYAGSTVAGVGDWNADGLPDVAIGAHLAESTSAGGESAGAVWLLPGTDAPAETVDLSLEGPLTEGTEPGGWYGWGLATGGDPDGDGASAVITGAPYTESGGDLAGSATLLCGEEGGTSTWTGEPTDAQLGQAVAGGADLDGDGVQDLLLGAPGDDAAWIVAQLATGDCGESEIVKLQGEPGSATGQAVAMAGDIDGDGYGDLLLGAPELSDGGNEAGGAYLLSGPVILDTDLVDLRVSDHLGAVLLGPRSEGRAGAAVAGPGDLDGDGTDDLLVGAPADSAGGSEAGAVYVWLGPVSGVRELDEGDATFTGAAGEQLGTALSGAGDVNDDGEPDFLVGAPATESGTPGSAYLVYGGGW